MRKYLRLAFVFSNTPIFYSPKTTAACNKMWECLAIAYHIYTLALIQIIEAPGSKVLN